jgi:hypothetical protein
MPSYSFDFPDDPYASDSSEGESDFSDEQEIKGLDETKPLRGDSMTHREVDGIMDDLGLPKQGRSSATINDKLFQIAEFMKENGTEISIEYSKRGKIPKGSTPKKRTPTKQTKVPTLLGELLGGEQRGPSEKEKKEFAKIDAKNKTKAKLANLTDIEKYAVMQKMEGGMSLNDAVAQVTSPPPKKRSGPKASTQKRKKYFDKREENRAVRYVENNPDEFQKISFLPGDEESSESIRQRIMSGEGPPPPRKPPAPPASPSPGDDEGDEFPEFAPAQGDELASDEILKETPKERATRLKREQDAKIKRQKDNLAAQRRREREDQAMAFRQRRKDIQSSAKQAQSQITETAEATGSDRMIRRLASFGIGRAIGGSGSLFAAAAEFGVFQPEEERARQETAQARQDVSARKEKELADLERDIFQTKRAADMEK